MDSKPFDRLLGVSEQLLRAAAPVSGLRQGDVLAETAHRPWALPDRPWFMGQTWLDLLFAHWRLPPAVLERVVPSQLPLDTFEGDAWLGVTPFVVSGLRLRGTPPVPRISTFPEINVRTYVTVDGRPGIYFLSLDAGSWAAVRAARLTYRLPYFRSLTSAEVEDGTVRYEAQRVSGDGPPASFVATYGSAGGLLPIRDGSLERWLTERYCLYTLDRRQRVQRADIHHPRWPLQPAEATIKRNTMAEPFGIELEGEPLLHLSRRQDVVIWPLQAVR
jgi:uncharacterized protein YqjF (DUF2071 family)